MRKLRGGKKRSAALGLPAVVQEVKVVPGNHVSTREKREK
jgi:hypothetical protein